MKASYLNIQDKLLKELLYKKDSKIISRKLGYSFNQISRWANHSKKLKWNEFINLCKVVNFPIENALEDVFGISIRTKADCNKAFVKILLSQSDNSKEVRQALHKSRPTLYRFQIQKSYPDVVTILALIDLKPYRLEKFVDSIDFKKFQTKKNKTLSPFKIPWFGVVSSAMAQKQHIALPAYSPEWIAKKVKLTLEQVEKAVKVMQQNQLISWDGNHYQPTLPRTMALNHKRSRLDFLDTLKFWTRKSITAIENHNNDESSDNQFTGVFRTFMATPKNVQEINGLIVELEEKIHNILTSTSEEKTEIRCFVLSHFDVERTEIVKVD